MPVPAPAPAAPTFQGFAGRRNQPTSLYTDYQIVNNNPLAAQPTPKLLSSLIDAGGLDLRPIAMQGAGTCLDVLVRYDPTLTVTTGPKIWVIGVDHNGVCHRLKDADNVKEWTLTPDSSLDCGSDATHYYSQPIGPLDARGMERIFVPVVTVASGNGFSKDNGAAVMAHTY